MFSNGSDGRRVRIGCSIVFGFMVSMALGCGESGPELAPAVGVVLLQGEPLADAAVTFQPVGGGPVASGVTDDQGRFQLETTNRPGALVGEHRVTITKQIMTGVNEDGTVGPGGMQIEWITPEKYASPETSGLTADVGEGNGEFRFELSEE